MPFHIVVHHCYTRMLICQYVLYIQKSVLRFSGRPDCLYLPSKALHITVVEGYVYRTVSNRGKICNVLHVINDECCICVWKGMYVVMGLRRVQNTPPCMCNCGQHLSKRSCTYGITYKNRNSITFPSEIGRISFTT
jgi:hypothetical protein